MDSLPDLSLRSESSWYKGQIGSLETVVDPRDKLRPLDILRHKQLRRINVHSD